MTSFIRKIYAMVASALEIWGICNENKLANFIAHGSFRCISSQFRRPKQKNFPREHAPRPPKTFDQDLVFALPPTPHPPPPSSLGCYLVLASTRLSGFSPLHRLYSAILHHRNKHRLKLYPRTVKIRLKNVGKKKGNSWYQTYSQI